MGHNANNPFIVGSPRDFAGRLVKAPSGSEVLAVAADVDHIKVTITNLTTAVVIGTVTITPSSGAIFNTPRTGNKYGNEPSEWNFEYTLAGTYFLAADVGNEIEVKFEFLGVSPGNAVLFAPKCFKHVLAACSECAC